MNFWANQYSGLRLVGAITKLGEIGPKHHGVIIGEFNGRLYVAESVDSGYQYVTFDEFIERYKLNGKIKYYLNDGQVSGIDVARKAVEEINKGGNGKYNIFTNNCESFVNRAMYGKPTSSQVVNTVSFVLIFGAIGFLLYKGKAA